MNTFIFTVPGLKITDTQVNFQWTFSGIYGNPFMHSEVPRAIHYSSLCVWSTVKRIIHASVRDHEKKWDLRPRCRQTFWVSLCPTLALWAGHSSTVLQMLHYFSLFLSLYRVLYQSTALTSFCLYWDFVRDFTSFILLLKAWEGWFYWQLDHQLVSLVDIRSRIWGFHLCLCFGQSWCCWVYIWDL